MEDATLGGQEDQLLLNARVRAAVSCAEESLGTWDWFQASVDIVSSKSTLTSGRKVSLIMSHRRLGTEPKKQSFIFTAYKIRNCIIYTVSLLEHAAVKGC